MNLKSNSYKKFVTTLNSLSFCYLQLSVAKVEKGWKNPFQVGKWYMNGFPWKRYIWYCLFGYKEC